MIRSAFITCQAKKDVFLTVKQKKKTYTSYLNIVVLIVPY